jgi:hypothetical protein
MAKFNIDRKDFYFLNDAEHSERTKYRLTEIAELGMEMVGTGEFGIPGIMSGLYIEKVWRYSDKQFNEYLDWVKSLIKAPPTQ